MSFRCLFRVLDSFGTEPQFNFKRWKPTPPGVKREYGQTWGNWELNPRQFMTMYRKSQTAHTQFHYTRLPPPLLIHISSLPPPPSTHPHFSSPPHYTHISFPSPLTAHTPDNSFLGFVVGSSHIKGWTVRKKNQSLVYGKELYMWKVGRAVISISLHGLTPTHTHTHPQPPTHTEQTKLHRHH